MKNEELLDKIKAEIEKRIKECEATYPKDKDGYWFPEQEEAHAIAGEYKQLLSFLSALEEQAKGYDESYIQSKIAKASETWKGVDVDEYLSQVRGEVHNPIFDECVANVDQKVRKEVRENIDFEQALYDHFGQVKDFTLGMRIGKYFYELGCRRTAEKYDEIEYNRQREETAYDTRQYTPRPSVDIEDVARVQFASHAKVFDKKRKAVFDWGQFKEVAGIFYGFGKKDSSGTLESEKPLPNDLEEAAKKFVGYDMDCDEQRDYEMGISSFIAGANWQKGQNDKDLSEKIAAAYQLGLADKEKQMMKEAVEGIVMNFSSNKPQPTVIVDAKGFNQGDRVRVIVLPKEDSHE